MIKNGKPVYHEDKTEEPPLKENQIVCPSCGTTDSIYIVDDEIPMNSGCQGHNLQCTTCDYEWEEQIDIIKGTT